MNYFREEETWFNQRHITLEGLTFLNASVSSNINEVIRPVLNFLLFFFYDGILHAQKAQNIKMYIKNI